MAVMTDLADPKSLIPVDSHMSGVQHDTRAHRREDAGVCVLMFTKHRISIENVNKLLSDSYYKEETR